MRLIDADELLDQLEMLLKKSEEEAAYCGRREATVRWDDAIISIKSAPIIEPVKHGRWIEQEHADWRFSKEFRCSECGMYRLVTVPKGWEWNYCPHCGAKMDGDTL